MHLLQTTYRLSRMQADDSQQQGRNQPDKLRGRQPVDHGWQSNPPEPWGQWRGVKETAY